MIKDFILPDIGEGVVECELVEWLVAEGDIVTEDQPIADVMTDKALVQIPAVHGGVIKKLHYKKGDIAIVHEPLYSVEIDGELDGDATTESAAEEAVVQSDSQPVVGGKRVEEFLLPDIGEGIVECELVEWLVAEGDMVVEDQPIADVMTDKALVQIPAIKSGKVVKLHYRKGQLAQVHTPLFSIEVESEEGIVAAPVADTAPAAVDHEEVELHAPAGNGKALASPAVRRLARSYDIDLSLVPGSGKHGRVYKEDVERFRSGEAVKAKAAKAQAQSEPTAAPIAVSAGDRVEPIRGVKAVMAKMMTESVSTIPHFTYCEELDLTELVDRKSVV